MFGTIPLFEPAFGQTLAPGTIRVPTLPLVSYTGKLKYDVIVFDFSRYCGIGFKTRISSTGTTRKA